MSEDRRDEETRRKVREELERSQGSARLVPQDRIAELGDASERSVA